MTEKQSTNNEVLCLTCDREYNLNDVECSSCGRKTQFNFPPLSEKIIKCTDCSNDYKISGKFCPECYRNTTHNYPSAFIFEKSETQLLAEKYLRLKRRTKEWIGTAIRIAVYAAVSFLLIQLYEDVPFLGYIGYAMAIVPLAMVGLVFMMGYFAMMPVLCWGLAQKSSEKLREIYPESKLVTVIIPFLYVLACFLVVLLFQPLQWLLD